MNQSINFASSPNFVQLLQQEAAIRALQYHPGPLISFSPAPIQWQHQLPQTKIHVTGICPPGLQPTSVPLQSLTNPQESGVGRAPSPQSPESSEGSYDVNNPDDSSTGHDESSTTVSDDVHSSASGLQTPTKRPTSSSNDADQLSDSEMETATFLSSLASLVMARADDYRSKWSNRGRKPKQFPVYKDTFDCAIKKRSAVPKSLKNKENHKCPNCGTTESTLWRNCIVNGKSQYLCNACGLRFKKGKYCSLCYKVYYDADTNCREWKQCGMCLNWTHKECLRDYGMSRACDDAYPFSCNTCTSRDH